MEEKYTSVVRELGPKNAQLAQSSPMVRAAHPLADASDLLRRTSPREASGSGPKERVCKHQATRTNLWEAGLGWGSWHDWGQK